MSTTIPELLEFVEIKIVEANRYMLARRQEQKCWASQTDDDARQGARLATQQTGVKHMFVPRDERMKTAEFSNRIATKYQREIVMLQAIAAVLQQAKP